MESLKQLIIQRIFDIVEHEGGSSMKNTMKWKEIYFFEKHIADLRDFDFQLEYTDRELLNFYDMVLIRYHKQY